MKKVLLSILIIAVLSLSLAGCSTSYTDKMSSLWQSRESYTYVIKQGDVICGSMTWEVSRINSGTVTVGTKTLENVTGTYASYSMSFTGDNAGDSVTSAVFFAINLSPLASYKRTVVDGVDITVQSEYADGKYVYTRTSGSSVTENSITLGKSTYYDNEMLYLILRCFTIDTSNTFTFNVPSASREKIVSLTMARGSSVSVVTDLGTFSCYAVTLTINDDYVGSPLSASIASDNMDKDGVTLKNVLVQLSEGDYTYTLQSIDQASV